DLSSGKVLKTASCLNPQSGFVSDVLSRIRACEKKENLNALTVSVREAINGLIGDEWDVGRMSVAGNATMLHLLCGIDPTPIGVAPFTPVFTALKKYRGEELGFPVSELVLLPSVSAYVGADITADILAADMIGTKENILLIDLGTNGEMALSHDGKIVCTSTAAGPALEGACIECGVGGVDGAVNRVWAEGDRIRWSTIGNKSPVGICGTGLVDLIALLLNRGEIDEAGFLCREKYDVCDGLYLSRADVRQFQLAKAAVSAGIAALLKKAGIEEKEIDECFIAGGLGSYMNVESAARTGLIPGKLKEKTRAVGNGSLYGAQLVLLDRDLQTEAIDIANQSIAIDLSNDSCFAEEFIRRMCFDELSEEI
ncbi:MAG: ASKHA domain-containing protein, partial [Clostridia bacterium]|nr:ASKHA domain-containing protein [Clostridia bacterium]